MSLQKLIQATVVRSNVCWPFSSLNRQVYRLATLAFVHAFRPLPEIRSLYLRHSLVGTDWVPGLSDIDLTVILDSELTPDKEFAFLRRFWRRFRALKKAFPMLGEVDVLPERQLTTWTRFGNRGHEIGTWRLLHGVSTLPAQPPRRRDEIVHDALDQAFSTYFGHLQPRFLEKQGGDFVERLQLERLTRKIARYAGVTCEEVPGAKGSVTLDPTSTLLTQALATLGAGVRNLHAIETEASSPEAPLFEGPAAPPRVCEDPPVWPAALAEHSEAIQAVARTKSGVVAVLSEDESFHDTARGLAALRDVISRARVQPTIANPTVLGHVLRSYYGPYFYAGLRDRREILFGEDPLPALPAPSRTAAARCFLKQTPNILAFARTAGVVEPRNRAWFQEAPLGSMLKRTLFIRLYLEKNELWASYVQNMEACDRYFSDEIAALEDLEECAKTQDLEALARRCFDIFRDLGEGVHKAVEAGSVKDVGSGEEPKVPSTLH